MSHPRVQNPTPLAYNITGAAQLLGLSRNHVRKLLEAGELRHRRSGKRVLIPRAALEAFLEGKK